MIVLAQAVIESTIRDLQTHDYETKAKSLFNGRKRLERLREIRNELLHPKEPESPSLLWRVPNGDVSSCHAALEKEAKRAIELMLYAIYSNADA